MKIDSIQKSICEIKPTFGINHLTIFLNRSLTLPMNKSTQQHLKFIKGFASAVATTFHQFVDIIQTELEKSNSANVNGRGNDNEKNLLKGSNQLSQLKLQQQKNQVQKNQIRAESEGDQFSHQKANTESVKKFTPIKRPQNAFSLFISQQRQKLLQKNPHLEFMEVTKQATQTWKNMSDVEKEPYIKRYDELKKGYDQEDSSKEANGEVDKTILAKQTDIQEEDDEDDDDEFDDILPESQKAAKKKIKEEKRIQKAAKKRESELSLGSSSMQNHDCPSDRPAVKGQPRIEEQNQESSSQQEQGHQTQEPIIEQKHQLNEDAVQSLKNSIMSKPQAVSELNPSAAKHQWHHEVGEQSNDPPNAVSEDLPNPEPSKQQNHELQSERAPAQSEHSQQPDILEELLVSNSVKGEAQVEKPIQNQEDNQESTRSAVKQIEKQSADDDGKTTPGQGFPKISSALENEAQHQDVEQKPTGEAVPSQNQQSKGEIYDDINFSQLESANQNAASDSAHQN